MSLRDNLIRTGIVAVLVVAAGGLSAMPTFARRYETSCVTCHQAFPRLNAVGESFRLMGFRFADDERYRKQQPIELGDEAYKRLWPRALWPSDVPRSSPLSFIMRMMAEGDLDGTRRTSTSFLLPEEIELVWAGNLGEDISFYGDVIYLQKDFGGEEAQSWATLKGWIQFQDILDDSRLNIRAGTVGTQTLGLFTARDANFYGTHFYLYTSWLMPTVNAGAAGLASFEGNNFSIGPMSGIEVNGVGKRWFYAVGVTSGDLAVPAGGPPDGDIMMTGAGRGGGSDVYAQLAWKLGGTPLNRSDEEQPATLAPASEFWRDDSTTLSLFAYSGEATIRATTLDGAKHETMDSFWRLGVGLQQQYRDVTVGAAWVEGKNDRPYGILSTEPVESRAWHTEVTWFAYPWLLPFARYESLDLELPEDVPGLLSDQDVARLVIGARAMIRPNVALIAETGLYTEGEELEEGFDETLFLLLSVSF